MFHLPMSALEYDVGPKRILPIAITAVSFAAILIRLSDSHPMAIAFYRMLFSTLILLPFVPAYLPEIKKLGRSEWLIMITSGMFLAVHFAAWISSLSYTSVASSVVLVTAHPIVVAWISGWYLGENTSRRAYTAILVALGGISIMTISSFTAAGWSVKGDILAIIGMLAVAGYLIRGREIRRNISVVPYVFVVYGISSLFLGVFSLGFGTSFEIYPIREYTLFFALALIPTVVGHTLYNYSLRYLEVRAVSTTLLGEPIVASVLAFFILSEVPPILTVVGAAITLTGIYICAKYS